MREREREKKKRWKEDRTTCGVVNPAKSRGRLVQMVSAAHPGSEVKGSWGDSERTFVLPKNSALTFRWEWDSPLSLLQGPTTDGARPPSIKTSSRGSQRKCVYLFKGTRVQIIHNDFNATFKDPIFIHKRNFTKNRILSRTWKFQTFLF